MFDYSTTTDGFVQIGKDWHHISRIESLITTPDPKSLERELLEVRMASGQSNKYVVKMGEAQRLVDLMAGL